VARPERKFKPPKATTIKRLAGAAFVVACFVGAATYLAPGCSGWDPSRPFERNSPTVNQALEDLDAGRFQSAEEALETYLGTGVCGDGGIGLPDTVRQKYNGSFDLGLVLFAVAEKYGRRFGEEEQGDGGPNEEELLASRSLEVDCALIIVRAIAEDNKVPVELRARAHYLAGNLEFLRKKYEESVKHYNDALSLIPGSVEDSGIDGIGRDAAWNRAIALRRIEEQKDAGQDAPPDAPEDSPPDAPQDGNDDANDGSNGEDGSNGNDGGEDGGQDGGQDAGQDGGQDGGQPDAGQDGGQEDGGPSQPPPPQPAKPESLNGQDERILDQFDEAPTYQEQEAKARAANRNGRRVMEDK
jgi:tetratricopeptide (TPR) repeat protein